MPSQKPKAPIDLYDPTDYRAWKWKAGAFRRVLSLCKTEAAQEKFIAQEFARIFDSGLFHGRSGTSFVPFPERNKK